MEGIDDLLCFSIYKHDGELDHLVQIGPRVLFARTLEVQDAYYFWDGALFRWWGWWRSWSLSLFASLSSSGLDSRQSGAFRGECYCRRCDECETHGALPGSPLFVRVLRKRRAITRCAPRRLQRAVAVACSWSPSSAATTGNSFCSASRRQITCLG